MNYMSFGLALALCSIPTLALTVLRYSKKTMSAGTVIFVVIGLALIQPAGVIAMPSTGAPPWVAAVTFCLYAPLTWGLGWQLYRRGRFSY